MRENKEDSPPNSRIFILHGRDVSKDEIHEVFTKFGKVDDIWMVRDKATGEMKGVTYVKYSKMSEAAKAVEEMNGISLNDDSRPLKVIIANSRDEGSKKDDDIEKFLRLFIVIPKDDNETEETLQTYFSNFGHVESVNILRNRETNASKGFAYVKYTKISHAAEALENCDPKYKCVLAKPKERRNAVHSERRSDRRIEPFSSNSSYETRDYGPEPRPFAKPNDLVQKHAQDQGYTRVVAFISTKLTEDLAIRLFDLSPGLIFARMSDEIVSHRTQKMLLEYNSPEAASFAVEKLHKFEYPVGEPIAMKPEPGWDNCAGSSVSSKFSSNERKRDYTALSGRGSDAEMGYKNPKKFFSYGSSSDVYSGVHPESSNRFYSSDMPPAQILSKNADGNYRLFVISQPDPLPLSVLKDAFGQFGNLIDAYLIPGKNYGYVQYSNFDSANTAMATLHGEEIRGNRLKVLEADPPRNDHKKGRYD